MRRKKDIRVVLIMMVVASLTSLCPADSDVMEKYRTRKKPKPADTKHPTVAELLDKYTQALDSTKSFIGDYEYSIHSNYDFMGKRAEKKSFIRGHNRHDDQRYYHQQYKSRLHGRTPNVPEDKPYYHCSIVRGEDKMAYWHTKGSSAPGSIHRVPPSDEFLPITRVPGLSYLTGYINSDQRLDTLLRSADRIMVRETTEKVGDSECFVIEADTKYGQYKLWLDPEHGFHPAKMRQSASYDEGHYSHHVRMNKGVTTKAYLDDVRFEKIDGIWVPMEADGGYDSQVISGEFSKEDYHYKRTDIILNPDHDKLGSFADPIFEDPTNDPELINGARVRLGLPTEYTWQDGTLIDKDGKKVDMEKIRIKVKNTGK